jgi:hypothetical protein
VETVVTVAAVTVVTAAAVTTKAGINLNSCFIKSSLFGSFFYALIY